VLRASQHRAGHGTLKPRLDALYASFNCIDSATDPIQLVRRFESAADREVAGFCAAAPTTAALFLYGRSGRSPISYIAYRIRRCTGFRPSRTSGSARCTITLIE
jgi:hypothetical protein